MFGGHNEALRALSLLARSKPALTARYGATRLALFGSTACRIMRVDYLVGAQFHWAITAAQQSTAYQARICAPQEVPVECTPTKPARPVTSNYRTGTIEGEVVSPEKAGVQEQIPLGHSIPGSALPAVAFAGMTTVSYFTVP